MTFINIKWYDWWLLLQLEDQLKPAHIWGNLFQRKDPRTILQAYVYFLRTSYLTFPRQQDDNNHVHLGSNRPHPLLHMAFFGPESVLSQVLLDV